LRIVLDSNILVRANPLVLPRGLARDLLLTIAAGPDVLVISTAILVEVRRVLNCPNVRARWPLGEDAIDRYLSFLEAAGIVVDLPAVVPAVVSVYARSSLSARGGSASVRRATSR
jgi:predicted nucleic acid-binding protein